ncbi:MAG: hypothetical protein IJ242_11910 [Clostridia bacterium]|nr:hypothetical protein [Clostridia bacterium]
MMSVLHKEYTHHADLEITVEDYRMLKMLIQALMASFLKEADKCSL